MAASRKARSNGKGGTPEPAAGPAESLAHYSDLFDKAPTPSFAFDRQGVVTEANAAATRLLQRERSFLIGQPFLGFVHPADRALFLEHMRHCRQSGGATTEVRLAGDAGAGPFELESRWFEGSDETAGYCTVLISLGDLRHLAAAQAEAERERHLAETRELAAKAASEAKDRLIAELSHELRTPLTPILAVVSGLDGRADVPDFLRPTIAMIRRNVEIEARLIDDLLDVSRLGQNRLRVDLEVCDAHQVLTDALAQLMDEAEAQGVTVTLGLNAPESHVLADAVRLRQIFWNLLSNALRNTPSGGQVWISTTNMGKDLRITFRDNGTGIDESRLVKIFEPFSQQVPEHGSKGLGLGLSIVKGLVESHGGRIVALSAGKGQGATFVVDLPTTEGGPLRSVPREKPEAAPVSPTEARPKKRLLVVEDHADTRNALRVFLELHGFEVMVAANAAEAVELARKGPDVIVCDIGLPDASGFDVMRRISGERPVKAIALSGYGSERDVALAEESGFAAHMTKPVSVEKLLEMIERLSP